MGSEMCIRDSYSISDNWLPIMQCKITVSYTLRIDRYVRGRESCGSFELAIEKLRLNALELFPLRLSIVESQHRLFVTEKLTIVAGKGENQQYIIY